MLRCQKKLRPLCHFDPQGRNLRSLTFVRDDNWLFKYCDTVSLSRRGRGEGSLAGEAASMMQFQEGKMRQTVLGLLLVVFLSSVLSPAYAAPVRIASAGLSGELLPLWVAQDRRLFKKHGLDTEVITIQGGPLAVQTLL